MAVSYNGWLASPNPADFGGLDNREVPGAPGVQLPPGVRAGDVADVLFYVAQQLHARVEPGVMPGCWGYAYRQNRNANNLSCHASATAFDWNAPRHPNGTRGTFSPAQIDEIHRILDEVEHVVDWGGDWGSTSVPDWMHFEISGSGAAVARVAARLRGGQPAAPTTPPVAGPGYSEQAKTDQFNLRDTGFDPGPIDGYWGEKSTAACRRFQTAARIAVDGVCGPNTRAALRKVPSWRTAPDQAGDGGYPARQWQQKLKDHGWRIEVDNIWGSHSTSILRQFQTDKGIGVDGIRGPESWTCLYCTVN